MVREGRENAHKPWRISGLMSDLYPDAYRDFPYFSKKFTCLTAGSATKKTV